MKTVMSRVHSFNHRSLGTFRRIGALEERILGGHTLSECDGYLIRFTLSCEMWARVKFVNRSKEL